MSGVDENVSKEQYIKSKTVDMDGDKEMSDKKNEQATVTEKVPFSKLFAFADATDCALMVFGVVTAIGSGLGLPLMTILFGELANSFGQNANTNRVLQEVSKVLCFALFPDRKILHKFVCSSFCVTVLFNLV